MADNLISKIRRKSRLFRSAIGTLEKGTLEKAPRGRDNSPPSAARVLNDLGLSSTMAGAGKRMPPEAARPACLGRGYEGSCRHCGDDCGACLCRAAGPCGRA